MWKKFLLLLIIGVNVLATSINAANPYCQNLGFELGNFTNWRAYSWVDKQNGTFTPKVEGIVADKHTIITTQGFDATVGGNLLKLIPDGFSRSVKIGSTTRGNGGLHYSMTYELDVTKENALVVFQFAVVLHDPNNSDHQQEDEPRFKVSILDKNGNIIPDCANYDVYASNARVEGWQKKLYSTNQSGEQVFLYWRDWTTVGINLTNYIGQKAVVEFMSANCRRTGHFGYAYFVAECQPLYITVDYCAGNVKAKLTAPTGFQTYTWKNNSNNIVGNSSILEVDSPVEGETYSCEMVSATSCDVELYATIYRFEPNADFGHDYINCTNQDNTIKFSISNPPTHGTLEYNWDFGDGNFSKIPEPEHNFSSVSGWVPVTLVVKNPPSTCTDSVTKLVETFNPPLVRIIGDTTFCPEGTTTLKAYGADHYEWRFNGTLYSKNDSIVVGMPGGKIELTGFTSNNECSTTKSVKLIEVPYWPFTATPDTLFCKNSNVTLSANGAISYKWFLKNKLDSILSTKSEITIDKPNNYIVFGTNSRGCIKSKNIQVIEDELPKAEFAMLENSIDRRHNKITCSIPQETGVNYFWNFGENDIFAESPATVTHSYSDLPQIGEMKITLRAVNENGCIDSSFKKMAVVPFFPNVFTPNYDMVNNKFLTGINIQVTDRYGKVIYKGNEGWDGTYSGKNMMQDTYFYFATYIDHANQPQTHKGTITLIR